MIVFSSRDRSEMVYESAITLACRVHLSAEALVQPTGNEAIVLDIAGERYFGLNDVGARVWSLLRQNTCLADAFAHLLEEYDVTSAELERDLIAIVTRLRDAGLAVVD